MLNLTWIKNPDHVSYCKENEVLPRLARELGIADLAQQVEEFRTHPTAEGVNLKGKKRTTLKQWKSSRTYKYLIYERKTRTVKMNIEERAAQAAAWKAAGQCNCAMYCKTR